MNKFMKLAIKEAEEGIKNGEVIGKGHNQVVVNNDPTCHAEVDAIRQACANIKSFNLKGCDIYTTGEPCPMCLSAVLWANIEHIYYGCTISENEMIGFRDEDFYEYLSISTNEMKNRISQIDHEECLKLFKKYMKIKDKVNY